MAKSGAIAVGVFAMALGVALGACTSEAEHAARPSTTLTPAMRQAASEATRSGAHIYRIDAMVLDGQPVGHGALRGKPGPVYARLYEAPQRAKAAQSI